jgi:hypothetical protein
MTYDVLPSDVEVAEARLVVDPVITPRFDARCDRTRHELEQNR